MAKANTPESSRAMYVAWLRQGLDRPDKTGEELAERLGVNPSAVSRMKKGEQNILAEHIPIIAQYIGIPPPDVAVTKVDNERSQPRIEAQAVPHLKAAEPSVWRDKGTNIVLNRAHVSRVAYPELEGIEQYAVRCDGEDFNKVIPAGAYAICVPFDSLRKEPQHNDIVEVERERGGLVETTLRRVKIKSGAVQLWPESDRDEWQVPLDYPVIHKNDRVRIVGLCVGIFHAVKF